MLTTIAHFKEKVIMLTTRRTEHNDKAAATVKPRNTFNPKNYF
jgi:hypothetical protein